MSLPTTIRHNQTTAIALALSIAVAFIFSCTLIRKPDLIITDPRTQEVITAAAAAAPPPYKEILLAISALLGSGIFVDNRRKDSVIKVLQKQNGTNREIISNTLNPAKPNTPGKR